MQQSMPGFGEYTFVSMRGHDPCLVSDELLVNRLHNMSYIYDMKRYKYQIKFLNMLNALFRVINICSNYFAGGSPGKLSE